MPATDRLEVAFELLSSTVAELHAGGRSTYAASVKPQLIARTNGGFDETQLGPGFGSFRDFLRAAADRGVVSVVPAPVGPDVEVLPIGAAPLPAPTHEGSAEKAHSQLPRSQPKRIRRELWDAFLDWTGGQIRAYDTGRDQVAVVPEEPAPLEPEETTALRESFAQHPERYVRIPQVPMKVQLEWMHDFAARAPEPTRSPLLFALTSDRPFRAFGQVVRTDPIILSRWQTERLGLVQEEIERWRSEHGLSLEILQSIETGEPTRGASRKRPEDSDESARLTEVRERVHNAVDRMPLSALYELKIPLEYVLEP